MESKGGKKVAQDLDNVAKATERVGKNQTRLGQASASAGRSFAAQSQGLGGIVGVYAAAAANVFALTAAFTALNRAAQFETILRGTEQLANAVGTDANSVVKSLKLVTAGQLSIVEAATQANLALSAGFNIKQIEQLGAVSLKASRALGRNLTDSFQRITRGAIKLEPELLDEIGIFTRIEPAVEAYAASINKSASSLTRFEKRQAFVTQVIKDGEAAFSDITNTSETTQEVFEKLVANFSDLAIVTAKVVADALVPFATFLDQNLGTRLALLGGIGLLVFGRLAGAIRLFATEGLVTLGTRLTGIAAQFGLTTKKALAFAAAGAAAQASFVGGGALPGAGRAYGAELKRELGEGLTTRQALVAEKEIPKLKTNELNLQKAINQNLKDGLISNKEATAEIGKSNIRKNALLQTETLITAQLGAQGALSKGLAAGLNFAAAAAAKLASFLSIALAAFNVVAIALVGLQLVGTLFDVDLLGMVTDGFKKLTAESRRTKEGLEGITENIKSTDDSFKAFTRDIGGSTAQKMIAFSDAAELSGETQKGLSNNILAARIQLASYERANYRASLSDEERAEAIKKVERELRANLVAQKLSSEETKRSALLVGTLAETSDVSAKSLSEASNKGLLKFDEATKSVILQLESGSLAIGTFKDDTIKLKDDINLGAAVAADFANKLENLRKKLANGTISADKAGTAFGVLASQAEKAAKSLEDNDFADGADLIRRNMDLARSSTGKLVEQIVALNQFGKLLSKTFGGAFKAVDEAVTSGRFNAFDGSFAKTQEEQDRNRVKLNAEIVKQFREQKKEYENLVTLGAATEEQSALFRERQDAANKIIKGTAGESLQLVFTLQKQRIAEEKKLEALQNQLKVQKEQVKLSQIGLDIAEQQADLSIQKNEQQANLKILENQSKLIDQQVKNLEKQLDSAKDLLKLDQDRAAAITNQRDAQRDLQNLRDRNALELAQRRADQTLDVADTRGISSPKALSDLRIKAAEAATALELQAIEQRRQVAIDDYINQTQAVDDKVALLVKEFELENQKRQNAESAIRREQAIADQKASNALSNNTAEFEIIASRYEQIAQQRTLADLQAKIAKEQKISELTILKANAELVVQRIAAEKEILKGNETIVNSMIKAANLLKDGTLSEVSIDTSGINTENITGTLKAITDQVKATNDIYTEQTKAAKIVQDTAIAGLNVTLDKNMREKTAIEEQLSATTKLNESKLTGLQNERTIAQAILDGKISLAELEKKSIADVLIMQMEKAGIERETAVASLEYAKEKARYELDYQARMDAANAATQDIVRDYVENGLMKLNDALIDGSITMGMVGNTFKDMVGNMLRDIQKAVFQKTITDPIGDIISSSVGSFFPTGTPGKASAAGGPVHMAGGGMKRDRVPALLEPGEFVMRKDAVKQFGVGAMMRMNAAPRGFASGQLVTGGSNSVSRAQEIQAIYQAAQDAWNNGNRLSTNKTIHDSRFRARNDPSLKTQNSASFKSGKSGKSVDSSFDKFFAPSFGATFDPTSNLAEMLGADGSRGFPLSVTAALLGLDVPMLFAKEPSAPMGSQTKARAVVNQRTGQMATGYKNAFNAGDVTSSGNFMRADETGVVSGIDPFALDKLGYSGAVAATMGGSKGFRAAGSGVEFSNISDFITANFVAPGRQSALTTTEYNAMSRESRGDYAPGLGGGRALTTTQASQLALSGAYMNASGFGLTIPSGGTFSGNVNKALSQKPVATSPGLAALSGGVAEATGGDNGSVGGDFSIAGIDFNDDQIGLASGGIIRKMAAGGAVQSRDRVPALLEPGEFVMRRPAAKAIGGAALNQMNATGKNLTPPNIQVNLNNEGAPKNVQAQPARVQGDKIIIDMITRDMRNNGPIKKSLRK